MEIFHLGSSCGRRALIVVCCLLMGPALEAQFAVTSPSIMDAIRPADDFATLILQDPWDMNERTDIGWFTYGIDQPYSNLTNISLSNGIFSAIGTTDSPNFWLLDTGLPGTAP